MHRLASQAHLLGLGLALILLATVAAVSQFGWNEYVSSADVVRTMNDTNTRLQMLLTNLRKAETAQESFLLAGDPHDGDQYAQAAAACLDGLSVLRRLNPTGADGTAVQLEWAVREKLSELRETVDLERAGRHAEALAIFKADRSKAVSKTISTLDATIEEWQRRRFGAMRLQTRQYARGTQLVATIGSAGIFLVLLLASVQIQRLIAARTRLNAELVRAAEEFRTLADSVPQMVWRTSESGELNYVNERWIQFSDTGRDRGSTSWQELLHPEDRDEFLARWQQAKKERSTVTAECRMKESKSGRYRWLLFQAHPVEDDSGGRSQWYATFTDIDDQKSVERALQRANAELQQFAYAAAHDLQEPLRNVSLLLGMARRNKPEMDGTTRDLIQFSVENARRMHSMIRDLLAYSRALDSDDETKEEIIDSETGLLAVLANLDTALRECAADVSWSPLPHLKMGRTHFVQLFQNLIGNALKYRKPELAPVIRISAVSHSDKWLFSISDNGIGFEPAYSQRIFGVFKRLHRSEYPGTGIGLAICARIVAHYGGAIWAEGRPGEGAVFHLTLPVDGRAG